MRHHFLISAVALSLLGVPVAARAQIIQGTVNGAQNGADQGNAVAGPLGGLVGGAIGAGVGAATGAVGTATGIAGGILGVDQRPRFHEYVESENYPSYAWKRPVRIGAVLPRAGVTYYEVPQEYAVSSRYRYARVNDRTVLVDPRSRRIVDVID